MSQFWQVAFFEYRRIVTSRGFLAELIGFPVIMAIGAGISVLITVLTFNPLPVGVVDQAGVLPRGDAPAALESYSFVRYDSESQARAALTAEEVQAYYLLPADYLQSGEVQLVYIKRPGAVVRSQFSSYLQTALLAGYPPEIAARIPANVRFTLRSLNDGREIALDDIKLGIFLPMIVAMGFIYLITQNAGYFLMAVADEKENRTLEVLVNSLAPVQLLGGKIISILAVNLTTLGCWGAMLLLALLPAAGTGIGGLGWGGIDWPALIGIILVALPSYLLVAALMTGVGSMVAHGRDGQPVVLVLSYACSLPLYLVLLLAREPHGPLAIVLSLLPFTSLGAFGIRSLVTSLPLWQLGASLAVQMVFAFAGIWLAGRAFRLGMLLQGKRLRLRALIGR